MLGFLGAEKNKRKDWKVYLEQSPLQKTFSRAPSTGGERNHLRRDPLNMRKRSRGAKKKLFGSVRLPKTKTRGEGSVLLNLTFQACRNLLNYGPFQQNSRWRQSCVEKKDQYTKVQVREAVRFGHFSWEEMKKAGCEATPSSCVLG